MFEYYRSSSQSYSITNHHQGTGNDDFRKRLKQLQSWIVWNIYKQLTTEVLDKLSDLKFSEIESEFNKQIIEKLRQHINSKSAALQQESFNQEFTREVHLQVVTDLNQIREPRFSSTSSNPTGTRRQSVAQSNVNSGDEETENKSNRSGGVA